MIGRFINDNHLQKGLQAAAITMTFKQHSHFFTVYEVIIVSNSFTDIFNKKNASKMNISNQKFKTL